MDSRLILRMEIEREELSWSDLCFESKTQSNQSYDACVRTNLEILGFSTKLLKVGVKKALNCSRLLSITRHHQDLEFLIFQWSVESHNIIAPWKEFGPLSWMWLVSPCCPIYAERNLMGVPLPRRRPKRLASRPMPRG